MKYSIPFAIVALCFGASCKHDPIIPEPIIPTDTGGVTDTTPKGHPCDPDTAYFVNDILPLLESNCAFSGCHGDGSMSGNVDLSSYASILQSADVRAGDPEGSDLYEVLVETDPNKLMPSGGPPLPDNQITLIRDWIQQGALNNSCDDCDTSNVTYSGFVVPVLNTNCLGCHNGAGANANIRVETYDEVKALVDNGRLAGTITHASGFIAMPYNTDKLSDCDIGGILSWINDGAPDN